MSNFWSLGICYLMKLCFPVNPAYLIQSLHVCFSFFSAALSLSAHKAGAETSGPLPCLECYMFRMKVQDLWWWSVLLLLIQCWYFLNILLLVQLQTNAGCLRWPEYDYCVFWRQIPLYSPPPGFDALLRFAELRSRIDLQPPVNSRVMKWRMNTIRQEYAVAGE